MAAHVEYSKQPTYGEGCLIRTYVLVTNSMLSDVIRPPMAIIPATLAH